MKPAYNRSEIFALAHKYRRESMQPGYKPQEFRICLIRAWAFARTIMRKVREDTITDYGSSYIVVTLPWSRYEEFRTGVGARNMASMPQPMQQWFETYGAH